MRSSASVLLGVVLLCAAGWSQSSKPVDNADAAKAELAGGASSPKPDRRSTQSGTRALFYSPALWEYWVNLTVPAGGSLDLDSGIDYSFSENVRVTVRSDGGSLPDVVLAAYWAVPPAPWFNVADVVNGNTFYYRNVGGATFNSYGSWFRLRIINNGAFPVILRQVLMFTLSPSSR